jgi:hypothetical protein
MGAMMIDFVQFFISLLYFSAGEKRKFWLLGAVIACITHGTDETATPHLLKKFINARLLVTHNDEV